MVLRCCCGYIFCLLKVHVGLVVVLFISAVLWSLCPLTYFTCLFFFVLRLGFLTTLVGATLPCVFLDVVLSCLAVSGILLETFGCVEFAVAFATMLSPELMWLPCETVFVRPPFFVC